METTSNKGILETIMEQLLTMATIIPSLLTALAVFVVGLLLAKTIRKIIGKLLAKSGVDQLADRLNDIDLIANTNVEVKPSLLISSIVYYLVLFIFIMAAVDVLGMAAISQLMTDMINYLPKAISAFFVFLVGILFCDLIKKLIQAACESLGIASARLLANVVFYFLFLNVALITLKQAELQTNFMEQNISIILGGVILAFSIGYGLASRPLMSNMLSAFYNKDRFQLDDELTVEGQRGRVIGMDNTTLTLRVEEGEVIIPLSKLSKDKYTIHRRANFMPIEEGNSND